MFCLAGCRLYLPGHPVVRVMVCLHPCASLAEMMVQKRAVLLMSLVDAWILARRGCKQACLQAPVPPKYQSHMTSQAGIVFQSQPAHRRMPGAKYVKAALVYGTLCCCPLQLFVPSCSHTQIHVATGRHHRDSLWPGLVLPLLHSAPQARPVWQHAAMIGQLSPMAWPCTPS